MPTVLITGSRLLVELFQTEPVKKNRHGYVRFFCSPSSIEYKKSKPNNKKTPTKTPINLKNNTHPLKRNRK